jgi:outer membrane protein assembly factor BamB
VKLIVTGTIFAGALLLVSVLAPLSVRGASATVIRILFDLGDGTYLWASESVPDPNATNATWVAVQDAAQANEIAIAWTWFGCCGVAISDLGGRHSPAGFIGLYAWNATAHRWDSTASGISSLVVADGEAIALYNAGYDSVDFRLSVRTPVPTPDDPLPAVEFRADLFNSGTSPSPAPDRLNGVLWDRDTGAREIDATPAVAYGKVFVATRNGTLAVDVGTGATLWKSPVARGFSSPAVFDNSVIVGTMNGTVVRLNATNGFVQWERRLLAQPKFSGITSSPKVAFDRVFIGTFNESGGPGEVVSLWASNGSVAWRHPTGSVHYSSPAYANGTVYVGVMGLYNTTNQVSFNPPYGVVALDSETGMQKWFFTTPGSVAASPAIAGSHLIVPSKDGHVYAIDRLTGILAWKTSVDAGISSPAVFRDTVYVGGGSFGLGGRVVALDVATGSQRWSFTPNGPVQASITYAGGKVFFATNTAEGTVYALNATTGSVTGSFTPAPSEYILGSPVVAHGTVFVVSDNGHVYRVQGRDPGTTLFGADVIAVITVSTIVVVAVAVLIVWRIRSGHPPK